jgi:hypothetical protein
MDELSEEDVYPGSDPYNMGWDGLAPGDLVSLQGPGRSHIDGLVDDISPDGFFMWLLLTDGGGRRLFLSSDGYTRVAAKNDTDG